MTPTLRQYDAGTVLLGSTVSPSMLIPPHFEALTYRGHCMPACLNRVRNHLDRYIAITSSYRKI